MELADLIALADRVIAEHIDEQGQPNEQALTLLEGYCTDFDSWLAENETFIRQGNKFKIEQLDTLVSRHEEILDLTQKLQSRFPQEMKALKARGRGILAYTDILPKKLSTRKGKEG